MWVGDVDAEIQRVYAIAFTDEGSILLVGGVPEDAGWPGLWTPGGGVKDNETPKEALARELLEEAGATIDAMQPLGVQRVDDDVWGLQHQAFYWCRITLDDDFTPEYEVQEYRLVLPEQFLDTLFWGRDDPKAAMLLERASAIDKAYEPPDTSAV